ncbi:hypothetical protein BDY21DRAFT_388268 [Lineolata rhizophorae]|uniref:Protein kinase domain-containing protein n=1 Tax=Lineolata rhizophorae TaxID=578093 RepID=A0A6A6NMN0_9PEZI|nr:hypothetical protein BDY21DRAFT_388268 [Lineolata rhizophorae]
MPSLFGLGQLLRGRLSAYTITRQLHPTEKRCHFRLENERDVLRRFQSRAPSLRPLIDDVEDPPDLPALVLKHLDDDVLNASATKRLTRPEVKHVVKRVLEVLQVLHEDGYVHTGMTSPWPLRAQHEYAREGDVIGAPIFRSPEAQLQIRWGTATDIADEEALAILTHVMNGVPDDMLKPFRNITEREIAEDKAFVLRMMKLVMKLDPRDRPTAKELLQDEWFRME